MQSVYWLLSVALAAQVGTGDDRYSAGPATPEEAARAFDNAAPLSSAPRRRTPRQPDTPQPQIDADDRRLAPPPDGAVNTPADLGNDRGYEFESAVGDEASTQNRRGVDRSTPNAGTAVVTPSALIRRLYQPPTNGQLAGISLSLAESVSGATTRAEQTRRIAAYWDLSAATADYYLSIVEGVEMGALHGGINDPGPEWQDAARKLQVRTQTAKRAAQTAQFQLQKLLGRDGTSSLPLATDLPHGGRYDGRYEQIFANRRSPSAERLDDVLSLRYDELRMQAADEAEASAWLNHVSRTRSPATGGEGLLRAYELLSLKRRTFLYTLRDYNQKIAAYAELAIPGRVAVPRLVAMHIRNSNGLAGWEKPNGVRRASAVESIPRNQRTFPGHGTREVRRQGLRKEAAPPNGVERSILDQKPNLKR